MKTCNYPGCHRQAQYLMSWENKNGKHSGLVCATHDNKLGRINLTKTGMPAPECILFERYLKETVELEVYPDWPEWLDQYVKEHGKPYYCGNPTTPVKVAHCSNTEPHSVELRTRPTTPNPIVRTDSLGREYHLTPGRKQYGEWRECIDCGKPIFVRHYRITNNPNHGKRCASCNRKVYKPPPNKKGQKKLW